jgi:hypothetical protein
MKKTIIIATIVMSAATMITPQSSYSRISESQLQNYSGQILRKFIKDNSESASKVRRCLGGLIKDSHSGIRLVDKLGIFMYDVRKHGMIIKHTRFFDKDNIFSLFILMRNRDDSSRYTLYLEYDYIYGKNPVQAAGCLLFNGI